jgi:hypothetical protein
MNSLLKRMAFRRSVGTAGRPGLFGLRVSGQGRPRGRVGMAITGSFLGRPRFALMGLPPGWRVGRVSDPMMVGWYCDYYRL